MIQYLRRKQIIPVILGAVIVILVILTLGNLGIWRFIMQTTPPMTMACVYPSSATCTAPAEYSDGRKIDVLKPEYYTLQDDGTLQQLTSGCNAYSAANVASIKAHSTQQFVTISGDTAGLNALTASKILTLNATVLAFLQVTGFTGVEIDFEGFGQWTPQQYTAYKAFIGVIGLSLHGHGYKLMVDGPAISDPIYQGYYPWKWEDFNALPVDYLVVMAYDYQYDQGAGTPVAPLSWLSNICQWMQAKITDHSKIVVGLNSYGYHGTGYNITKDTYEQSTHLPGFSMAQRDTSSGEMMWTVNNGTSYDYSDAVTLQGKLSTVQNTGLNTVSVWHLGGNAWFSGMLPSPTVILTQDQVKAIYNALTPAQIEEIQNIITG